MNSVKVLTLQGSSLPDKIRNIPDAPKLLYSRGINLEELLSRPWVAIVGSRKVDAYGTYVTKMLAGGLAQKGIGIISGLALGTDAIAHRACLESGVPSIAVLASGIDYLTPRTNYDIAVKIMSNGAIISEHDKMYAPHKYDFLIRNRLISGFADGLIIPQAAARSGSLNTARHALEQGRVVMAVPGPITNPLSEGPNNLIKMGATSITSVDDVLKALNIVDTQEQVKDYELLAQNQQELSIIKLMLEGETDGEVMVIRSGLSAQEFNVHLTMLEIRGVISPLGANHWALS